MRYARNVDVPRSIYKQKLASFRSRVPESNQLNAGAYGRGGGVGRGLGVGVGLRSAQSQSPLPLP